MNKSNISTDCTAFKYLDLNWTGFLCTKIYDKRGRFFFPIVYFPFLDGVVPLSPSYGFNISQLVRFARVYVKVSYLNDRNLHLIANIRQCHLIRLTLTKVIMVIDRDVFQSYQLHEAKTAYIFSKCEHSYTSYLLCVYFCFLFTVPLLLFLICFLHYFSIVR